MLYMKFQNVSSDSDRNTGSIRQNPKDTTVNGRTSSNKDKNIFCQGQESVSSGDAAVCSYCMNDGGLTV